MFRGFQQVVYPEYEVVCPQSHDSFNVRTLTVQEEEKLKGSMLTPVQITDHLNRCIFECIVGFPEHIKDYESFLKNVTLKDRDALLYGLYHVSYGEIRNYDVTCSAAGCGYQFPITINASDAFGYNLYPADDKDNPHILKKRKKISLPIFTNVYVNLKQPTLNDELRAYKEVGNRPGTTNDLILSILPIESIEEDIQEQTEPNVYNDREDIIDAYRSLPSRDKKEINNKYNDEFGQYGIEMKTRTVCPKCGNDEIKYIDLVENFFSMVYTN